MKRVIRNLRFFVPILFKTNPFYIFIIIIRALVDAVMSIANVYFPKLVLDVIVDHGTKEELFRIIIIYVLIIFASLFIQAILNAFDNYFMRKAQFMLDGMFNKKVATIDYFLFEDPKFNEEMNYASECMNRYTGGIYSFVIMLQNIIRQIVTISGVIAIVIAFNNPILLLFLLINLIVAFIVAVRYQNTTERYNVKWNENRLKHWYFISSIFDFPRHQVLRSYDGESLIKEKGDFYSNIALNNEKVMAKENKLTGIIENLNSYVLTGVVLAILLVSVFNGKITIPELSMLFTGIFVLQGGFESLVYCVKTYLKDCKYLDNYINFMERDTIYKNGTTDIDEIKSIEFRNVYFKYPRTDNFVLEDVSFKIDLNKKISLVGVNGAGKTTIIKLMCRFYDPTKGDILINGIDIKEISEASLLMNLSIVFQDFKIISFNIKDNIEIDNNDKDRLDDALKKSLIYDRVQELPNKEYTYINKWFDKEGIVFSGGEMQKFAFSRSLYKDGSFVVLDEPTSALDALSEAKIYKDFNEIVGKKPTLYISHRLSSCIFSDEIIVLDGKRIAQVGSHEERMKDEDGLYSKMFKAQAEYYNE